MFTAFATFFQDDSVINLGASGLSPVYSLTGGIAFIIAALLFFVQLGKMAYQGSGKAGATALVGIVKFTMAYLLTLTIVGALLSFADGITEWIIDDTLGGGAQLSDSLKALVHQDPATGSVLVILFGFIGIIVSVLLFFEMIARHAAVTVLVATSPIAAAGQVGGATGEWFPRLMTATIQLIAVKPVIALVFAVGFNLASGATDISGVLSGLLVLVLAVVAWPVIAKFFTFTATTAAISGGIGAAAGFAAARLSGGGGGSPAGLPQGEMNALVGSRIPSATIGSGSGAASGSGASGAGALAAAAPAAAPVAMALRGAKAAADTAASLMHNTAHHAGLGEPAAAGRSSSSGSGSSQAPAVPATGTAGDQQATPASPPPPSVTPPPPPVPTVEPAPAGVAPAPIPTVSVPAASWSTDPARSSPPRPSAPPRAPAPVGTAPTVGTSPVGAP